MYILHLNIIQQRSGQFLQFEADYMIIQKKSGFKNKMAIHEQNLQSGQNMKKNTCPVS